MVIAFSGQSFLTLGIGARPGIGIQPFGQAQLISNTFSYNFINGIPVINNYITNINQPTTAIPTTPPQLQIETGTVLR